MTFLLPLLAAWLIVIFVHVTTFAVVGRLMAVGIDEVRYFFGPTLLKFRVLKIQVRLRSLPLGGNVKFEEESYHKKSLLKRLLLTLSACTSLLIVACICLGAGEAWISFTHGYVDLLQSFNPASSKRLELIAAAHEYLKQATFWQTFGVVCAKICAVNLLPLPVLNGGLALWLTVKSIIPISETVDEIVAWLSLLIWLAFIGMWVYSLVSYVL